MTILSELKKSIDRNINPELNALINQKLLILFDYLCPFDLSNSNSDYFIPKKTLIDEEFHYEFKYGQLRLTTYSNKLHLCIFFNSYNVPMIPAGSQWCHIDVDAMLNYKKATFQSRFNFGEQLQHHPDNTKGSFYIDKTFDSQLAFESKLVYSINGFHSGGINFNQIRFPKVFFENNNEFHAPLMNMLEYCSTKPDIFYAIFEDYPCHENMIDDPDEFKSFLRLYHAQYTRSKKDLKSKVLLLDMQAI